MNLTVANKLAQLHKKRINLVVLNYIFFNFSEQNIFSYTIKT